MIELYAAGRGDDYVLGGNFNLLWYKQVVQGWTNIEERQTTMDEVFKNKDNWC